jgi:hypothetical protein
VLPLISGHIDDWYPELRRVADEVQSWHPEQLARLAPEIAPRRYNSSTIISLAARSTFSFV